MTSILITIIGIAGCDDEVVDGDADLPSCEDDLRNGDESDTDCGGSCDPCSVGGSCFSGSDCMSKVCSDNVCASTSCEDRVQNGDETDIDCGGTCGSTCEEGASCTLDQDCSSYLCIDGECLSAICGDGRQNGDESDIDCGGSCEPCPPGRRCTTSVDCQSLFCSGGVCEEGTCQDMYQNNDETGIDCGGPLCDPCPVGSGCREGSDCVSRVCEYDICQEWSCEDNALNGDESDVDCGGSCEPCDNDRSCSVSPDCSSLYCGDGVCRWPASCLELKAGDAMLVDGLYQVQPTGSPELLELYCNMTIDAGGWTLVASTLNATVNDERSDWYQDLTTLFPARGHEGVWDGMRGVIDGVSDIRFTCKGDILSEEMRVDLSFYATDWYREITAGSDAQSCFSQGDGEGYEQPAPARRDNKADIFLRRGNDWGTGYLEGEDSCDDEDDFTVDFDDRGMESNESDGTDWGEDDGRLKCGFAGLTIGAWFIWVREAAPHCVDGVLSGEETGIDCGGVCGACADGLGCDSGGECSSGVCIGDICQAASCEDGVTNGEETDIDCGGTDCDPCEAGKGCVTPDDCDSKVCDNNVCDEL